MFEKAPKSYEKKRNMRERNSKIKKGKFITLWAVSFCALFTTASILGLVPESENEVANESLVSEAFAEEDDADENKSQEALPEIPLRVRSNKVGLNTTVLNPDSTDIGALNNELSKGAVRYPGSGLAGGDSNMFIFGHSSHLPVVNNQAYKAFNNIENLSEGDEVIVETENHEFVYTVTSVDMVNAEEALVEFKTGKGMLTLSTCNNFGARTDRFVVEAELSGSRIK